MKSQLGPPMTLGSAATAEVRLIVWCKGCSHQVEPDSAEMAARYGAGTLFSNGAIGSFVRNAADGRLIWS
jgi:hypothetical protein